MGDDPPNKERPAKLADTYSKASRTAVTVENFRSWTSSVGAARVKPQQQDAASAIAELIVIEHAHDQSCEIKGLTAVRLRELGVKAAYSDILGGLFPFVIETGWCPGP